MNRLERTDQLLLIAFAAALVFPLQYAFRGLDDNTLTNWQWVFRQGGAVPLFLLVLAATVLALFLSRIEPGPRAPAMLAVAAMLAVVPLWSEPEVILDASRYFSQAKAFALHGPSSFLQQWGREISAWTDLPAVPLLYGMAFRLLAEERLVIQGITTLLFGLTVLSTYRVGRTLAGAETGLLAGVLLLAFPYLLTQVPLMLVDVPTMALLMLSLDLFLTAALQGGPLRGAAAVALIVTTLFAKFSVWLMLPVLPLALFAVVRTGGRAAVLRALAVLGAAAALGGAILFMKFDLIASQAGLLRSYQLPALGRWSESPLSTFFFQVHPFVPVLAVLGLIAAVRSRDAGFLVPAYFVVYLLALRVERIRYLVPLFPLLALMAAGGLRALPVDGRVRRFAALSAAGASVVLALFAYLPFLGSTTMANLRDAGRYLDSLPGEAVEVHVLPQQRSLGSTEAVVPLLDLYTRKTVRYRQGPQRRPPQERVLVSPLRFTWEVAMPAWYTGGSKEGLPRVIISSGDDVVPAGTTARRFEKDTGTFRYRTVVSVLDRNMLARTAQ